MDGTKNHEARRDSTALVTRVTGIARVIGGGVTVPIPARAAHSASLSGPQKVGVVSDVRSALSSLLRTVATDFGAAILGLLQRDALSNLRVAPILDAVQPVIFAREDGVIVPVFEGERSDALRDTPKDQVRNAVPKGSIERRCLLGGVGSILIVVRAVV